MLNRNLALQSNEAGQGIEGLGTPDPNYLATVKENRLAHEQEVNAGQYEKDIKEGVGAAAGVAGDMARLSEAERMGVLGSQTSAYDTYLGRPQPVKWWQTLLGGAAQVGAGWGSSGFKV